MKELTIEEIQQESFKVLLKLKEIFDKKGWKYYLAYGTLIGAIRHNGFIPWDDDIDIWVPRDDYEKFIQYCIDNKEELGFYELHHYKTNRKYIYPIARFSDSRYNIKYFNAKDYGLGIFVDIYPLDGIEKDDKQLLRKIHGYERLITLCGSKKLPKGSNLIKNILKIPYYYYSKTKDITKILSKIDQCAQKYQLDKVKNFTCVVWSGVDDCFSINDLGDGINYLFNGEYFPIPNGFDSILKQLYGDYMTMPPIDEQIPHHCYSVYKK